MAKKNLYIIITNSFQNDFIGPIDDLLVPKMGDNLKLDYAACQDKWIEYFKGGNREVNEAIINQFNTWIKSNAVSQNIDSPLSYHRILEKYKHRVHINHNETMRLWQGGRLNKFIKDLMNQADQTNRNEFSNIEYQFIHLRDWHDLTNPSERGELDHFGPHCIKGTYGSKFAFPLNESIKEHPEFNTILNSNSISSFDETDLEYVLDTVIKNAGSSKKEVNIGVFGVITNVKVQLIVFELKVIHNYPNVHVCQDFCAAFNKKGQTAGVHDMAAIHAANIVNESKFREIFKIPNGI